MNAHDINYWQLAAGYALLLFPIAVFLWHRVPLVGDTIMSVARMTAQLLFVGFYLQFVFRWNSPWLNLLWIAAMVVVADASITRGCGLRASRFLFPLSLALLAGVLVPLLFFVAVITADPVMDARFVIPIAGMILGTAFGLTSSASEVSMTLWPVEKAYLQSLASGARMREALMPFVREALAMPLPRRLPPWPQWVVSLPGMMTGVILGGADPATAIKYQIAIMLAIFSGTAITVTAAIYLTVRNSFSGYGILDRAIFRKAGKCIPSQTGRRYSSGGVKGTFRIRPELDE